MHLIARHSTGNRLLVLGFPFLNFELIYGVFLNLGNDSVETGRQLQLHQIKLVNSPKRQQRKK